MLKKLFLLLLIAGALTIGLSGCIEEGELPPPGEDQMLDQPSETF